MNREEKPQSAEPQSAEPQLDQLRALLRAMGSALVCFSGGIDSALVLAVASEQLGEKAIGMTAVSPSLPQRERAATAEVAARLGVRHEMVDSHEMKREGYRKNGPDRCFHCKSELYFIAAAKQKEWKLAHVLNGTNTDDLGDYRPGLDAAREAGARSPLVEVGINKLDVRRISRHLGLPIWDKPASACLSSRLPYGTAVTSERLRQVESLEEALHELGFAQVRVRYHETVARLELPPAELPRLVEPDMAARVTRAARAAGFQFAAADLLGYRTGSLNELLPGRRLNVVRPTEGR